MANSQTIKDCENFIKEYAFTNYAKNIPEPFGIVLKSNQEKVIGTIGCFWVSKPHKSMEIGYVIGEEHWGKGITAEAGAAVLNIVFKEFKLNRIQARAKSENKASARVMEKLGMKYEGTLRNQIDHAGGYWDMLHYSILHSDVDKPNNLN